MKKVFFIGLVVLYIIPCNSTLGSDLNGPVKLSLEKLSMVGESDTVPPVAPVDPEYGDGDCIKDRNRKRRDLIREYSFYFFSPNRITVDNLDQASFKSNTPPIVIREFYDYIFQVNIEYQRCIGNYGPY